MSNALATATTMPCWAPGSFACITTEPLSSSGEPPEPAEIAVQAAHDEAVAAGRALYADPATGYLVFTAPALAARGYCCGNGCRHCPYPLDEQRRAGRPGAG
jgi:hypothetical protein